MIAPPHWRAATGLALLLASGLQARGALAGGTCDPGLATLLAADATTGPPPVAANAAAAAHAPAGADTPAAGSLALPGGTLHWSADRWSTDMASGNTQLEGGVQLSMDGREIGSDRLDYLAGSQELRLAGTVTYRDPSLAVSGSAGRYGDGQAEFTNAQFELLAQPGRGSAARISVPAAQRVLLDDVRYTTCSKGNADWLLRARRITLDLKRMRGLGRDTRVEFKGVPILYLPALSFPLSSARQTGFLFPSLGSSSRGGATLQAPWYWNIAPNQDLTLVPKVYTRRGLALGAEYRLLEHMGSGTLALDFLPSDRVSHADRGRQRLDLDARLGERWQARVRAENVSDSHYLEDFADGALSASTVYLPRQLRFSLRDDARHYGAEWLQYQTLDDQLARSDRPYAQLPRLTAGQQWHLPAGLDYGYSAELGRFWRPFDATATGAGNVRGWRGNLQPGASLELVRAGWWLKPAAALDLTAYRLSDVDASGASASPTRTLPIVTIDSGMQLERADAHRLITLEPRLYYAYIPYRDQSQLPDFDSGLPDPNFSTLFRANRYTGLDRIGEANNLTLGLTARLLHPVTGQRLLAATIGQQLHFDSGCTGNAANPRCVLLPGETPDRRHRSDLVLNLDVTALRHWNVRADLAWDPAATRVDKGVLNVQYRPSGERVANLGYRYARPAAYAGVATPGIATSEVTNQAEASVAWPVARRWDIYARSVYAFGCSTTYEGPAAGAATPPCGTSAAGNARVPVHSLENFAGFQFRGDCWGLRLVARDAVSRSAGSRDRGWYLQLELNGLSSVGSGAEAFLRGAIRGYSPASTGR